jgi:hypothetical protein
MFNIVFLLLNDRLNRVICMIIVLKYQLVIKYKEGLEYPGKACIH